MPVGHKAPLTRAAPDQMGIPDPLEGKLLQSNKLWSDGLTRLLAVIMIRSLCGRLLVDFLAELVRALFVESERGKDMHARVLAPEEHTLRSEIYGETRSFYSDALAFSPLRGFVDLKSICNMRGRLPVVTSRIEGESFLHAAHFVLPIFSISSYMPHELVSILPVHNVPNSSPRKILRPS